MTLECFSILIIIGLLCLDFMRRHRKEYALCSAPLLISPFIHLMAVFTGHYISELTATAVTIIADSVSLAVTVALIILCENLLKSKKSKIYYTACCGLYSVLFTSILILYTLSA